VDRGRHQVHDGDDDALAGEGGEAGEVGGAGCALPDAAGSNDIRGESACWTSKAYVCHWFGSAGFHASYAEPRQWGSAVGSSAFSTNI
jgi:hypothetical protein